MASFTHPGTIYDQSSMFGKNNVEEERQLKRVMTIYITWATLELLRAGDKETKIHSKRVR